MIDSCGTIHCIREVVSYYTIPYLLNCKVSETFMHSYDACHIYVDWQKMDIYISFLWWQQTHILDNYTWYILTLSQHFLEKKKKNKMHLISPTRPLRMWTKRQEIKKKSLCAQFSLKNLANITQFCFHALFFTFKTIKNIYIILCPNCAFWALLSMVYLLAVKNLIASLMNNHKK